jgi:hypothetical protein
MELCAIALQGLQQAQIQVEASAARLTGSTAATPDGISLDIVDLSAATLSLLASQNQFETSVGALKIAQEMEKSVVVNLLA